MRFHLLCVHTPVDLVHIALVVRGVDWVVATMLFGRYANMEMTHSQLRRPEEEEHGH